MRDDAKPALTFAEVTPERWGDFEALFAAKGGPHYCWCTVYRDAPDGTRPGDNAAKKAEMARRVAAGEPVGIAAYADGQPVGWCSVAPRGTFRRLGAEPAPEDAASVWSITCFYVPRRLRGQGMTAKLLAAAVAHAREQGANAVEAYPVDPESPSYGFMGRVGTFEAAGFREIGRLGSRRHVMRLEIAPGGSE